MRSNESFPQFYRRFAPSKLRENRLFRVLSRVLRAIFFLLAFSVQAQTPYYYLNRSFSSVQFNLPGIPTEYLLNEESDKLTDIVQGTIETNNCYAIEKHVAIAIGYGSALSAWNAATNYNVAVSNYPGKIFDNVGWVLGTKSVTTNWGAYIWVLQNRIEFQASTSAWWSTTNGIPVAISNVMVGSLGDYQATSNVIDIGPVIPSNFPGANQDNVGTYQVDITNVYYTLIIPDIWIMPRDTVAAVGGSNVQYTVYGTNIPNGVTWSLIPDLSGSGGATIQTNGAWQTEITPGSVATNYIVRATSKDYTNFCDQVSLTVIKVEIKAADGTGNPREYVDADTEVDSSYNTVSYKAVVTPSVSGAFSWSTTSSKITLTDASSQIVTVNAGANASASVGAEDLKIEFAPSGSTTTCDDTHNLTVVHCTLDAFADKTVLSEYEIGHGWWKLAVEPNAATTLIQPMNCRIWVTEAGYFPIITGCPYSDGIVKMGFPTGHSVTGNHEWDIPFIKLVAAAIYCRNLDASPGTYWVFGHNCCAETISVGGEATVTIQGGTPSTLDTYLNGL